MNIFAYVLFGLGCLSLLVMLATWLINPTNKDMYQSTAMMPQTLFIAAAVAHYLA